MNTQTNPETSPVKALAVFDIDGVIRNVSGSYRRALADTVEHFTGTAYRPTANDIDRLKSEGVWNNDWLASQELVYRYFESQGQPRHQIALDYNTLVDFFQSRYRGSDAITWNGYICQEPLLLEPEYLQNLTQSGIGWGFFSGAPRGEAAYVLEGRLGISKPVLVAMEDAPDKPDPTGLLNAVTELQQRHGLSSSVPVIYAGDTVADMYTIKKAQQQYPGRRWVAVGILPPHVQQTPALQQAYTETLKTAGADLVLTNITQLTPALIKELGMGNWELVMGNG